MKPGSLLIATIVLFLTGCAVRLPVAEATARNATEAEVRRIVARRDSPDGVGSWTALTAVVRRETVERIAGWQLYTHMLVTDCATGITSNTVSVPTMDGVPVDDYHALDSLLAGQPQRDVFALEGYIFARPSVSWQRQCLQLNGGNYAFQKIASDPVPIRFEDTAG